MKKLFVLFIIVAVYIFLFALIKNNRLYDDEPASYNQIRLFINKKYITRLYIIPGYHFTVSAIANLSNKKNIPDLRATTLVFNLLSIVIFFFLAQKLDRNNTIIKTLQYSFFPVIFPFHFLLYPEGLQILFTLTSIFLVLKNKIYLSALFGIASILTRQTNIIWFIFIHILAILNMKKIKLSRKNFLIQNFLFFIGYLLFLIFVVINKGFVNSGFAVKAGERPSSFSIFSGNVFFMIFAAFCLFLPIFVPYLKNVYSDLRKSKILILVCTLFILVGSFTFSNSHPWNLYTDSLQNKILLLPFTTTFTQKLFFFSIISITVFLISNIKFLANKYYLIYPLTFLMLLPIQLISIRYYIIPFTLFILFHKVTSVYLEVINILLFILISLYLYYGYLQQVFYI